MFVCVCVCLLHRRFRDQRLIRCHPQHITDDRNAFLMKSGEGGPEGEKQKRMRGKRGVKTLQIMFGKECLFSFMEKMCVLVYVYTFGWACKCV